MNDRSASPPSGSDPQAGPAAAGPTAAGATGTTGTRVAEDRVAGLEERIAELVVEPMLADLRSRLAEGQLTLEVTAQARRHIAIQGYDPVYGARPLRRFVARQVETRIARALIAGDVPDSSMIRVDYVEPEPVVSFAGRPAGSTI